MKTIFWLIATALFAARVSPAQQPIAVWSEVDQYVRLLELDGKVVGTPLVYRSASLRPRARGLAADSAHLWAWRYPLRPGSVTPGRVALTPIDWELGLVYNSAFPETGNDGALWAGKGVSAALSGGALVQWGPLTGTLHPTATYAQNDSFDLRPVQYADLSPFAYPWSRDIDWPQRFGDSALTGLDWGQSGLRLDLGAVTTGFSTENLWWGPGYRNAIIMSNTAAGFPHIDLGTAHPVATPIGEVEVRAVWGALHKSAYFDSNPAGGRRFLTGLTLGYRPSFLPGLTVGLTRLVYEEWPTGGLGLRDLTLVFGAFLNAGTVPLPSGASVNDLRDQMASVMARWLLPASGFEAYAEWARNDFAGNLRDLLVEPDHTRAFTLGFQKSQPSGGGRWRLAGEVTTLGAPPTFLVRGTPTFYEHGFVVEGYTNRGQLMGAAIGPGSNSQYLGLDRYASNGRWGIFLERVRYNDDAFYFGDVSRSPDAYLYHQVDLTLGASVLRFVRSLDLAGKLELTRELNRYYVRGVDMTNVKLTFGVKWRALRRG